MSGHSRSRKRSGFSPEDRETGGSMRVAALHARASLRELMRMPGYVVPTLGFPTMFFLFFAAPGSDDDATTLMVVFAGFAVLGVAFFQFGVGIATERATPWERYVRTLPVSPTQRFGGRIISALVFAAAAAALVLVAAVLTTSADLRAPQWGQLALALLLGSIPFALFGIALGYLAPPRAALPIANVVYLTLSYCGGLWTTPDELPDAVQQLSPYLPTRALADTLVGIARGDPLQKEAWLVLALYTGALFALAAWAYRRDEGERYR